jgi:hypothetical protein
MVIVALWGGHNLLHVLSFCLFPRALQYGHISSRLAGIADRQDPPVKKEGHLMSFPKTISERFPAALGCDEGGKELLG